MKAFEELIALVTLSSFGIVVYPTAADLYAVTPGENDPKIAIVNDDPTPANNGFWSYRDGDWYFFTDFYNSIALALDPRFDALDASVAAVQAAQLVRDVVTCTASGSNTVTLTPVNPAFDPEAVSGIYQYNSVAENTGTVYIVVEGFNDGDPRILRFPDGTDVNKPGTLPNDQYVMIKYRAPSFELLLPVKQKNNLVGLVRTNSDVSNLQAAIVGPVYTGGALGEFLLPSIDDRLTGDFATVYLEIDGYNNGDPREVRYYPGLDAELDKVDQNAWYATDTLKISTINENGVFILSHPPRPVVEPEPEPPADPLTEYYKIQMKRLTASADIARLGV